MSLVKERINEVVENQPEDTSYEEILRELAFDQMIVRGLDDSKKKRVISNEEMKLRIKEWK
ncbi:MAG: hypothetical protein DRJ05_19140 [Bacteroidetes bacterium]|nr:MAG: hypothetical protein DRJ05_19140 [Bacteroidota bacterium]